MSWLLRQPRGCEGLGEAGVQSHAVDLAPVYLVEHDVLLIPQEYDESIGSGVLVEVLLNRRFGGSEVRVVETGQEFFCAATPAFRPWPQTNDPATW